MNFSNGQNRGLRLPALFILLSLVGYLVAGTVALHLHVLPDGRIVVHNHTSRDDAGSKRGHSHTDRDYQFISHITSLLTKSTVAAVAAIYVFFVIFDFTPPFIQQVISCSNPVEIPVRAPPFKSA